MLLRVFLLTTIVLASCSGLGVTTISSQTTDTWSLVLSAAAAARPGEEVTYVLKHSYSTSAPPRQVPYFFTIPQGTTFVSVSDTAGTDFAEALVGSESVTPSAPDFGARTVGQPNVRLTFIPNASDGQSTVRVKIDSTASGSIKARAVFGATGLGGSNEVVTTIESTQQLPSTGANGARGEKLTLPRIALLLCSVGLATLVLGTGTLTRHPS